MILAIKIMKHDLAYEVDIRDCLIYNSANPEIKKIVVFSEFEVKGIKIDSMSKKISWMKVKADHYEAMSYAAKAAKDIVIYSVPFIKFAQGIGSIREKVNSGLIFRCPDSYYLFSRYSTIEQRSSIDGILGGVFSASPFDFDRSGYFNAGYPASSLGWKICDYQADEKRTEAISKSLKIPAAPSKQEYLPVKKAAKPSAVLASENRVRKLDVVIVSVDYNDFLEITLERNSRIFDRITVVTSSSDKRCVEICEKFGASTVVTDCMYSDGAPFNKAKAINEGMASISDPDFILILDADIIVQDPIDLESLEDESAIYYKDRMMVEDYASYERFCLGFDDFRIDAGILTVRSETFGPLGYFQLFKYQEKIKYIESYTDAAWSDVKFARRFRNKIKIGSPAVHLGEEKKNWYGRVTEGFVPGQSISVPRIEKKKSTYTICTYYFDFRKDERQKSNFIRFLSQFEGRYDNLVVGLVDYGDDGIGFDLPCRSVTIDGDPSKRRWSKEILVNKISKDVDTDYILWMDADLIYEDISWLDDIDSVADGVDFVQLFKTIEYLGEEGQVLEKKKSIASSKSGDVDRLMARGCVPGGAWLGKTSIIKEKGLFEKMYVGGGDTIFLYALKGISDGYTLSQVKRSNEWIWKSAVNWIDSFGTYRVGFLDVNVSHLYHGKLKDRNYNGRYKELKGYENYDYDFCVVITTYNRPEMLRLLLDDIAENSFGKRILVTIFDDGSNNDYAYLDEYDIKYVKYVKNNGKFNYWKMVGDTFKYCGEIRSKYYIYLPDDIRLKNDFFEDSVRIFEKIEDDDKICLNLLMDETRRGRPNWTGFDPIEYDEYYKTQWNDMCFISNIEFFETLNFEMLPIDKSRWSRNKELGSGVGQQMSIRLLGSGKNMYHVISSMVTHDDHDSVMNFDDRKKNKLIAV